MKKFVQLTIILSALFLKSSSQVFVGGSLSFGSSSGNQEIGGVTYDDPTSITFIFNPMGGYMLSENFGIGVSLEVGLQHTNSKDDPEIVTNTASIGLSPFVRYYVVHANKFTLFGQAQPVASFSTIRSKMEGDAVEGPIAMMFGITAYPGMAYELNDRIQLNANINIFNLGFIYSIIKDGDTKERSTETGFGMNLSSFINTGTVAIGAIIRL